MTKTVCRETGEPLIELDGVIAKNLSKGGGYAVVPVTGETIYVPIAMFFACQMKVGQVYEFKVKKNTAKRTHGTTHVAVHADRIEIEWGVEE